MRTPDASGPVRTCVGCRRRRPVDALVRLTRSPDGIVVGGASVGRGAWLCRDEAEHHRIDERCVATAITKRAFARAWRSTIDHDDEKDIREHTASFGVDSLPETEPRRRGPDGESDESDSGRTH